MSVQKKLEILFNINLFCMSIYCSHTPMILPLSLWHSYKIIIKLLTSHACPSHVLFARDCGNYNGGHCCKGYVCLHKRQQRRHLYLFILGRMENLLKDGAKKTKVLWVMLGVPNSSVFASFSEHLALIAPFPLSETFILW